MKLLGALEKPFYATVNPAGGAADPGRRAAQHHHHRRAPASCWSSAVAFAIGTDPARRRCCYLVSGVVDTLDGAVARGRRAGDQVRRLLRLDARPGRRRRHVHRDRASYLLTAAGRGLPGAGDHHLHGGDPRLAAGVLRPGPGRGARASTARWGWCSGRSGSSGLGLPSLSVGAGPAGHWCSRRSWRCSRVASVITVVQRFVYVYRSDGEARARTAAARYSRERTLAVADQTARPIAPAKGKLGVLCVGLGAVATTFIAGVEHVRRGPGAGRSAR